MDTKQSETQFEDFVWIDVLEPDWSDLEKIAKMYDLDYFQISDSLEKGHLPKFEKLSHYNFLILRAFTADPNARITDINELSNKIAFFYNDKKLLTVHRADFEFLKIKKKDFKSTEDLMIYLISKMVETFVEPCEVLDNENDEFERMIFLKEYTKISLEDLYFQKVEARLTKKLLQISQNVINQLEVNDKSQTALQDVKDKLLNLILLYDELLENSYTLLNTYMSVNAKKTNDVMKLLTIFSAFFLPLTFIVGVYGMNFENMPELKMQNGYYYTLLMMFAIAAVIYFWFKRKRII